jgi:hypothetical protein
VPAPQRGLEAAPVHARYIAGQPEVNHRAYTSPLERLRRQTAPHQDHATCHDLQRNPLEGRIASSPRPPSRAYYKAYLPPGRAADAMFAPTFARMSRYGPVAADITRHQLSWPAVQSGRSRHASAQNNTRQRSKIEQSSGLLTAVIREGRHPRYFTEITSVIVYAYR